MTARSNTQRWSTTTPDPDQAASAERTAAIASSAFEPSGPTWLRPAAAALPADRRGSAADQIDGGEARGQVVGDADDDARLAVLRRADEDGDARSQRLLALVGQRLQVFGRDARNDTPEEADAADILVGWRAGSGLTAAERQFLIRL